MIILHAFSPCCVSRQKQYRDEAILAAIGSRVREVRILRGLSQQQLAHHCGIELSQINRIELGKINTSISHLYLIAGHLDIAVKDLLDF